VIPEPPAGTYCVTRTITFFNYTAAVRDCRLAIQTSGPTQNIFHVEADIPVSTARTYEAIIVIKPGTSLVASLDAVGVGGVVVGSVYANYSEELV